MLLTDCKLAIEAAFQKIGNNGKTAMPESRDNRCAIAYEYFVADTIASFANKRKEKAKKAAEEVGILLPEDAKPGTNTTTYENEYMSIVGKVNNPAMRLDEAKLAAEIAKHIGSEKARDLINSCKKESAPAKVYTFAAR